MKFENKTDNLPISYCLIILSLGITLSLIATLAVGFEKELYGDEHDYLHLAEILLSGGDFPREHGSLPFFRAPLFPYIIYFIWIIFPKSIIAVKLFQCFVFGLTSMFLSKLAFYIFKNKPAAILSGLIYSFNPFAIIQTTYVQNEPLHILLTVISIFLILKAHKTQNIWLFLISGLFWGIAALCRPSALPIALVVFGMSFILNFRKLGLFNSARILAAVLGLFLAILPWTAANFYKTGDLILINDAGGYNFWYGNQSAVTIFEGVNTIEEYQALNNYGQHKLIEDKLKSFEETNDYYHLSLKQREKLWQDAAISYMAESPTRTVRIFVQKIWEYWRPYLSAYAYPYKLVIISFFYFTALYVFGFIGALNLWKINDGKNNLFIFLALFISSMAVHVLIISNIRMRMPYVDPYLTIFTAFSLWLIFKKISAAIKTKMIPV